MIKRFWSQKDSIYKRLTATILSLLMVLSLVPFTAFAETDNEEPAESRTELDEKFNNMMNPGTPDNYSEDMANPYGYDKGVPFLLSEKNELLLYYTWDAEANSDKTTGRRYTVWYDKYLGEGSSMDLRDDNKGPQKAGFNSFGQYSQTDAFGYTTAVAFDPTGSGKKDYVAYVGYESTTDKSWNQGYVMWILDTRTGTQYGPFSISNAACGWLDDDNVDLYAGMNFFNVAAGDFDGDGKDTLIVSVVDNDTSYGLSEITFDGSGIQILSKEVKNMLHPAYNASCGNIKDINKNKGKEKLSMGLTVGDFDGDGIEDLAVLSYPNLGNQLIKQPEFTKPYLGVVLGVKGDGILLDNQADGSYLAASDGGSSIGTGIASGDIDNNGKDEILTAGYANPMHIDGMNLKWEWLYSSFSVSDKKLVNIEYQYLEMNEWSTGDSGMTDNVAPRVAVAAVAVDGKANAEHIFISGNMYQCGKGTNTLNPTGTTLSYFKGRDEKAEAHSVGKSYLASVAVGNFEETNEGREQIAYVVGLQTSDSSHKYYFSVHMAGGSGYKDGAATGYYQQSGGYIYRNQPFGLIKRPNCIVVAIDRDDDGIVAKYKEAAYAWSDPEVMAILQASPYFADVEDYLYDSPDTTYNETVNYEFEYGKTNAVSFGAGATLTLMGTIGGFDFQTGYAMDWSETFKKSLSKSVSQSFSAGAYDTVVLNRTPVFLYNYDITYYDGDKLVNDVLQISVPYGPRYEQLSIGGYNEFVSYYNQQIKTAGEKQNLSADKYESSYLKPISDDLYLETEGDPFGYYIDGVSGGLDKAPETYGDPIALNKVSGISSTECSFSESEIAEKSSAHGFTFDLTVKFGFNAGFVESNAGAYVSLQYMNGYTTTTTNGKGTAFAGTVMGLNGTAMKKDGLNPDAWGFNWKLGKWDSNIQNSKATVPVIGYVLSDVKAPPFPVNDLEIAYTQAAGDTGVTFDLTWEKGDKDGSVRPETVGYKVYLYDPSDKEYKLLETIRDVDTCSYQYTGNADGREIYSFAVKAYSAATTTSKSAESVAATANFYMATAESIIQKIEKTGTEGLVDTYSIYLADGRIQTFTVTNGVGIVSLNLKERNEETGADIYEIVFTNGTSIEYTVQNGKDGADGADGVDGKDGVNGVDGTNGKDGVNGVDGVDGKDGTDSIPASASIGENSLDEMQMRLDKLEKQAEKKAARDKLVYVALALSILSLLWNATTLITEFMKKKREEEK